jgi:hypothetical protein
MTMVKKDKPTLTVDTGTTATTKLTKEDDPAGRIKILEERVRELVGGTSERYVARPNYSLMLSMVSESLRKDADGHNTGITTTRKELNTNKVSGRNSTPTTPTN